MAACSSLASVGKLMFFGCTVVSTVTRLRSLLRSAPLLCATRRLSANSSSNFVAESLSPMAQVGAFVRELVLKKLFPGEELKVWIVDPALAHAFIGQSVNMLEQ